MSTGSQPAAPQPEEAATRLLALAEAFVRETRPGRALERELGIDSLGRAELLLRAYEIWRDNPPLLEHYRNRS